MWKKVPTNWNFPCASLEFENKHQLSRATHVWCALKQTIFIIILYKYDDHAHADGDYGSPTRPGEGLLDVRKFILSC